MQAISDVNVLLEKSPVYAGDYNFFNPYFGDTGSINRSSSVYTDPALDVYFNTQKPVAITGANKPSGEAVIYFAEWIKKNYPDAYQAIVTTGPEMLVPEFALSGMYPRLGFAGIGEVETNEPSTDWGKKIMDIVSSVIPLYQQKELFQLQLKRAEMGLPPIDPATMAPTVNVGVSPQIQQLGYLALFGFLGLGVMYAFRNKRR